MGLYIITLDRERCIGAASCCTACPKFWKLNDDGKVGLVGGGKNADNSVQTREIEDVHLRENMDAAQVCPVNAIHIKRKESGQELI